MMAASDPVNAVQESITTTVRPSVEELLPFTIQTCDVDGCQQTFQHVRALRWHKVKTHKIVESTGDMAILHKKKSTICSSQTCVYYCPVEDCINHHDPPFTSMKRLKEHYMHCHAEKKFICPNCHLGFGLERALKRHRLAACGLTFNCGGCGAQFSSKTAMQTHCRKTDHPMGQVIRDRYNALGSAPSSSVRTSPLKAGSLFTSAAGSMPDSLEENSLVHGTERSADLMSRTVKSRKCDISTSTEDSSCRTCDNDTVSAVNTIDSSCGTSDYGISSAVNTIDTSCGTSDNGSSSAVCTVDTARGSSDNVTNIAVSTVDTSCGTSDNGTGSAVHTMDTSCGTSDNCTSSAVKGNVPGGSSSTNRVVAGGSGICGSVTAGSSRVPPVRAVSYQPTIVINVMNITCTDPTLPRVIRGDRGQRVLWPKLSRDTPQQPLGPITCATQTSDNYILEKALTRSKIPKKKVSIGSQVSPKSRQKSPKSTRTACVQTSAKKRRRPQKRSFPCLDDLSYLSDMETQTNTLIEELQASLGASISTQTKDSFLSTVPDYPLPGDSLPNFMTSSGTNPMPQNFPILSNSGELIPSLTASLDDNFNLEGNCHSNQTQTIESMFEQLLNNMETQTPFTDFGFGIDNETQTVAPQSVETQTSLHGRGHTGNDVKSSDIETQTTATDFDPSLLEFAQFISGMG